MGFCMAWFQQGNPFVKIKRLTPQSESRNRSEAPIIFAGSSIVRNSLFIVSVLIMLAAWSAISGLLQFGIAWQLAVIFPTMLAILLILVASEKSKIRNSNALQSKLDRLIHAAETIQNRMLDMEKPSNGQSARKMNGFADWSPARENGHAVEPGPVRLDGTPIRHHAETAVPERRNAGAHRITPSGKA